MSQSTPLPKADLRLFLQQLQANPVDICLWPLALRISLLRNGTLDLTVYGQRIISVPRLALMAVSPAVLAAVAKNPATPAINFTFDVLSAPVFTKQAGAAKMDDQKVKWHVDTLRAFAHWLTALCTPAPVALAGCSLGEEIRLRHICRVLKMESYASHLTGKFIGLAGNAKLLPTEMHELVRSCRDSDDMQLNEIARMVVQKISNGTEKTKGEIRAFLQWKGNELLKSEVLRLQKDMGLLSPSGKKRENVHVKEIESGEVVEVDKDGWQVFPGKLEGAEQSPNEKEKFKHEVDRDWEMI